MKKIFLSAFALLSIIAANAQNERSAAGAKVTADPLVNGIPYSQYKAQQEALQQKAQQPVANNIANAPKGLTAITGSGEKPVVATPQKTVNVKGTSFEPLKPADTKVPAKKEESKSVAQPSSVNG